MSTFNWTWPALATAILTIGCGGTFLGSGGSGETPDGGVDDDASADGSALADGGTDNPCVSPSGYAVCGGPNNCFPASQTGTGTQCESCPLTVANYGYDMALCQNAVLSDFPTGICDDDCVYVQAIAPVEWNDVPYEIGVLFAQNGGADRVRYADWTPWTGDPLPTLATCSPPANVPACGSICPPCASGDICTGRSPTHPYGMCFSTTTPLSCAIGGETCAQGQGLGCFVFKTDAADQTLSDDNGTCLPVAQCQASAAQLPGGGVCAPVD